MEKYKMAYDHKEYQKQYKLKNKEKLSQQNKEYYQKNKELMKEKSRKTKIRLKEYYNQYQVNRRKNNPIYRLNHSISCSMSYSLKINHLSKKESHWENLVGYTVQNLKEHIEKLFKPGMSWNNYGQWHIDHIIPKTFFKYKSTQDVEFKYCWSLHNLQPLWAEENIIKGDKLTIQIFSNE